MDAIDSRKSGVKQLPDERDQTDSGPCANRPTTPASPTTPGRPYRPVKSPLLRSLLFACGWLAVILGAIGIFLPVVPTTPFLLVAAACFIRSSERFYDWLIGHTHLGPYLIYYLDGQGMPARAKLYTLILMWSSMGLSAWLVGKLWVTAVLLVSGLSVSFYIGRLPVRDQPPD